MPNNKQSKKRLVQSETRKLENKFVRSRMRTEVKKVLQADSPEAAKTALPTAMQAVDKAAKKNIIHANAAARKKSQLNKAVRGAK